MSVLKTDMIAGGIALGIITGKGMWDTMKNATPKFVYNDGWTQIDPGRVPIQVGNYAIILPSIKSWNMYWHFSSPVWITPIDAIKNRGRNLVANVRMEMSTIEQLPMQIRGFIIENGLKPPYYLGMADVDQYELLLDDKDMASKLDKPSVGYLIQYAKESNQLNSMLIKQLAEAYNVSEETIASKMRIMERMRPSQIGSTLARLFLSPEESKA